MTIEDLKDYIPADKLLREIAKSLSTDQEKEIADYIARIYDIESESEQQLKMEF